MEVLWVKKTFLKLGTVVFLACSLNASLAVAVTRSETNLYRCTAKDGKVIYHDGRLLAGHTCKSVTSDYAFQPHDITHLTAPRLTVAEAKKIVANSLLDPEATRFKNIFKSRSGSVCGNLNAKNIHGGYAGYAGFVVTPWKEVYILGQGNQSKARLEIRENCSV